MADSGACGSGQAGPRATSAPGPKTRRTFRTSRTGEPPAARSGSDSQISLFQPALLRASFVQRHLNVGGMEAEHRARLNRTIRRTSSRNGRNMSQRTGWQTGCPLQMAHLPLEGTGQSSAKCLRCRTGRRSSTYVTLRMDCRHPGRSACLPGRTSPALRALSL